MSCGSLWSGAARGSSRAASLLRSVLLYTAPWALGDIWMLNGPSNAVHSKSPAGERVRSHCPVKAVSPDAALQRAPHFACSCCSGHRPRGAGQRGPTMRQGLVASLTHGRQGADERRGSFGPVGTVGPRSLREAPRRRRERGRESRSGGRRPRIAAPPPPGAPARPGQGQCQCAPRAQGAWRRRVLARVWGAREGRPRTAGGSAGGVAGGVAGGRPAASAPRAPSGGVQSSPPP